MNIKESFKIVSIPVLFASLCCLSPIILVLLGLSTVTFAASLTDILYGEYKWVFRALGLLLLGGSLVFYFRKKGICTLDQVKRERNKVINILVMSLLVGVAGYIFFLYGVVHYFGVWLGIWE